MRNSWQPLIALVVIFAIVIWLLPEERNRGVEGPQVPSGIYNSSERFVPALDATALRVMSQVHEISDAAQVDARLGLEIVPYDQIAIIYEDDSPTSRAIAKGLAEELSGHLSTAKVPTVVPETLQPGMIVMVPPKGRTVPVSVRRVIRLRVVEEQRGLRPQDEVRGRLLFHFEDAYPPLLRAHPGLNLLPQPGVREGAWQLDYQVQTDVADVDWIDWHIAVGRRLATAIVATAVAVEPEAFVSYRQVPRRPAAVAPPTQQQASLRAVALAMEQNFGFIDGEDMPQDLSWTDVLAWPPGQGVESWQTPWQAPLVRGWTGRIYGLQARNRKQELLPSLQILRDKIERAGWEVIEEDENFLHWGRGRDGGPGYQHVLARRYVAGWHLAVFEAHPQVKRILRAWLAAAKRQDATARAQLRRHLGLPLFGGDELQELRALFIDDPAFAVQACLGSLYGATQEAQQALVTARYLRGLDAQPPAEVPPASTRIRLTPEPQLLRSASHLAVAWQAPSGAWLLLARQASQPPVAIGTLQAPEQRRALLQATGFELLQDEQVVELQALP